MAPSRRMAWAMPQAMDRSVATPTMSARLPVRKPIVQFAGWRTMSFCPGTTVVLLRRFQLATWATLTWYSCATWNRVSPACTVCVS